MCPTLFNYGDSFDSKLLKNYTVDGIQPALTFVVFAHNFDNPTKISLSNLNGGAEEDRTPDLLRARQSLSQLSYGPNLTLRYACWWVWVDLNHRPRPYQGRALTN